MIVLIGFMGAGKSTVGRLLAQRLALPFRDSDEEIERLSGRTVAQIFQEDGESAFRALEEEVVLDLLSGDDVVVALGGGAPLNPSIRKALPEHDVVYLDAGLDVLLARLGDDPSRPMLQNDPQELMDARRPIYSSLSSVIVDARRSPDELAGIIERDLLRRRRVVLGERSYDVLVAPGVRKEVAGEVARLVRPEKAFIVSHPSLARTCEELSSGFRSIGIEPRVATVPEGESSKSLETAASLLDQMASWQMHRGDVVIGTGGGVITDLAGFVASVFARGISVVHVPTTLLAQVDAAIGGKTGVDLPQAKNLVGTFHQPRAVFCDTELLATLPDEEFVSGLAEVVKAGLVGDSELLGLLKDHASAILDRHPEILLEMIGRAVQVKASVVSGDERESGRRAILNYGHTFAHAIEVLENFGGIRHGEAVSIGMMAAAHLAEITATAEPGLAATQRQVLEALGLPVSGDFKVADLEPAWKLDKKYSNGVRFVLLRTPGEPVTGVAVERPALEEALERMAR